MATRISASVRPYVLTEKDRHLVSRFSFGVDEALTTAVRAAGGGEAWFAAQLKPSSIGDPAATVDRWFPLLGHDQAKAWREVKAGRRSAWEYGFAFEQWSMVHKVLTRRQLEAVVHDLWSNLLYVPAGHDRSFPWRFHYDRTLRGLALTSYRQLLRAAVVHPAMSGWLNNDLNTKRGINENLGRELLELYTVGRDAGYTEDDVKGSARLLTGYKVKVFDTFAASYSPDDHWTGRVSVMGFTHANSSPDGRAALAAYLDHLALHPATAQRIARRLCVRLVGDDPSPSLVRTVAAAYRSSRSDVKATLKALRTHPEFLAARRSTLRAPVEDVVATVRALGIRPTQHRTKNPFASSLVWSAARLGQEPYRWPRPDGFPEASSAWASPSRVLGAWNQRFSFAGRWNNADGQAHPAAASVLPTAFPRTLAELVDHQSRLLVGRPADPAAVAAVASMTGRAPGYVYKSVADVSTWHLTLIRGTVLNAPDGMLR
jgi:uncharacterized protein (DUF1800 family)